MDPNPTIFCQNHKFQLYYISFLQLIFWVKTRLCTLKIKSFTLDSRLCHIYLYIYIYRKIHTKHPPWHFRTHLNQGGCLKRCGNLMIFLPTKIHFKDFITIFLTNFHDIFVLFRGGCLQRQDPKISDLGLNQGGGGFSMNFTVRLFCPPKWPKHRCQFGQKWLIFGPIFDV